AFDAAWSRVVLQPHVPVWYGRHWQRYQRLYAGDRVVRDASFVIVREDVPIAVAQVLVEQAGGRARLSCAGAPLLAPIVAGSLAVADAARIERAAFERIESVAREHEAAAAVLFYPHHPGAPARNPLRAHGYLDWSTETAVIDLQIGAERLWSLLRASYKPLIN